jgi:high-affinity Fe2+/Pb2+ permease
MSSLNKLKLVASKPVRAISAVQHRRNKLAAKLTEQIQLATAQRDGRAYTATRLKTVTDPSTGQRTVVEAHKRVKEWYWAGDTGRVHLALRYGSKTLEIAKGKNAIEVANGEELLSTLELLRSAVLAGELDTQMETASKALREGFVQ